MCNEEISVAANAVQVESESTQLGDVIESKKMLALPLNGRSYIDLLGPAGGRRAGTAETIQQDRPVSGNLNRRQHLSQWPARDGKRVSGERRRCQ